MFLSSVSLGMFMKLRLISLIQGVSGVWQNAPCGHAYTELAGNNRMNTSKN
jgi:hypothetical protein